MRGRATLATGCAALVALVVAAVSAAADPQADRHGGHDPHIGGFKQLVSQRCWSARRSPGPALTTVYDTTSILATIEHGLNLQPVADRDAEVTDLSAAVQAG